MSNDRTVFLLPPWQQISIKIDNRKKVNPIEDFIYQFEPAGEVDEREFREKLQNLIDYVAKTTQELCEKKQ